MSKAALPSAAAILAERARLLARPAAAAVRRDLLEVVVFELAGEACALETSAVLEVTRFTDFAPVPGGPPCLLGVTNLRGEILPVFDLGCLLGMAPRGLTGLSRMVVAGEGREELCLLADAVLEVRSVGRDEVLEAPAALSALAGGLLRGVTRHGMMLFDGARLLQDPRLFVRSPPAHLPPARKGDE